MVQKRKRWYGSSSLSEPLPEPHPSFEKQELKSILDASPGTDPVELVGGVVRALCNRPMQTLKSRRSTYFQNLCPPNVLITRKCQQFVKIMNDTDAPGAKAIKRKEHSI